MLMCKKNANFAVLLKEYCSQGGAGRGGEGRGGEGRGGRGGRGGDDYYTYYSDGTIYSVYRPTMKNYIYITMIRITSDVTHNNGP